MTIKMKRQPDTCTNRLAESSASVGKWLQATVAALQVSGGLTPSEIDLRKATDEEVGTRLNTTLDWRNCA
jgi:hypothetical protein